MLYNSDEQVIMYEAIAGYSLGCASIALLGHVGGGMHTMATDVCADLSGTTSLVGGR